MALDPRLTSGLGVLGAIVEAGSLARAADLLDLTPSGVSRALARLEARLGVRVLNRSTRAVSLTDEGRAFYERVGPLLAEIEEAANMAGGAGQAVRGRLRINVDPFFSRLVLAPQLGAFVERYPALELEIVTRDHLGDLVAEGFDVAIRFGEPRDSSLVARKLFDTRVLTVASPAYLARHGRPAHPSELVKHECLQYRDPESRRLFPWEFHRRGKVLKVPATGRVTLNDVGTMHGMCVAGYGIAQVLDLGAHAMLEQGQLVELFADWSGERFPLFAFYPSRRLVSAKTRAWLDFIVALSERKARILANARPRK